MRSLIPASAVLLLTLAACAQTAGSARYADEVRQLTADCEARGGFLVATDEHTGRPQTDYFCRMSGAATRLEPGG